jgi:hypothetical protein
MYAKGRAMGQNSQKQEKTKPPIAGLKPFISYRNTEDDKIRCALQEAVRELRAEGKPLVLNNTKGLN